MIARLVFLTKDGDVVVSTVNSRTHQIAGTGIEPNILFINVLLMDTFCYQVAIWSQHEAAQFSKDRDVTHSGRNKDLFKLFADAFADHGNIIWLFVWCVWDSDTAGQVDIFNIGTGFFFEFHCQTE